MRKGDQGPHYNDAPGNLTAHTHGDKKRSKSAQMWPMVKKIATINNGRIHTVFKKFFEKIQLNIIDRSVLQSAGYLYDLFTDLWWKLYKFMPHI